MTDPFEPIEGLDAPEPLTDDEQEALALDMEAEYGHLHLVTDTEPAADRRPIVKLGLDLHRVLEDLDQAMGESDPLLYQRDNELVGVVGSRAKEGKVSLRAGTPILRQLTKHSLLPRLTKFIRCTRFKAPTATATSVAKASGQRADGEWVECWPTPDVINSFLNQPDWLHIHRISGITECPTIRPDGTVLQEPGYDLQTGYVYIPNCDYLHVPDEPTHSDAVLAYKRLADVFCDFPYVDDSHRAAAVASVLTLVARPAIEGSVPCFLFDASSRRSGKTLQVDVASLIASGRVASRMTYPENDEELEKVLSGYAITGARMVNFDNVARPFGGAALDKCITSIDTVDLRLLGASVMRTLTWRSVIFASGNNIKGRGDILERVLSPRIESNMEHPELRDPSTLQHPNLRRWVAESRIELVQCALTVIRAYCAAGRPKQRVGTWGGFEPFTNLIPAALVWVGAPNPLGARRGGEDDDDPTRAAERGLVNGWKELCALSGEPSLTVSAAMRTLYPPRRSFTDEVPVHVEAYDALREAVAELAGTPAGVTPDSKKLGDVIRRLKRKVIDGSRFEQDGTTNGSNRWKVVGKNDAANA